MKNNGHGSKREKQHGPYVRLQEWLLASAAWKSLDGNSRAIYIEMARRYRGPNSTNGKIPYSVREAAAGLHIGKNAAQRCLNALMDRGFIRIAKNSGFNVKGRVAREWLLTEFPDDTMGIANTATKDFMTWKSLIQIAPRARRRSFTAAPASPIRRMLAS